MRTLESAAHTKGLGLERLVDALQPVASAHFGPNLRVQAQVLDERVQLSAVFTIEAQSGPAALGLETVRAAGVPVELGDELEFLVFFSPDEEGQALEQDEQYATLLGLSSVACGFWPVARSALSPLLGLRENPVADVLQRALLCAVAPDQRHGSFALRRGVSGGLLLKEAVVVGVGDVSPGELGRRDLVAGVTVEVTRREVSVSDVVTGLFDTPAVSLACESTSTSPDDLVTAFAERGVHLARRTLFRQNVERFLSEPDTPSPFEALVASEREARFLPSIRS